MSSISGVSAPGKAFAMILPKRKTNAREILPKEDVWFWDGRVGRAEGDYGVGIGGGDSGEEGGSMKGAGIEEVGGFCGGRNVSNDAYICDYWSENRDGSSGRVGNIRRPDLRI